jgi:uncharacterized spore protein YtfJ
MSNTAESYRAALERTGERLSAIAEKVWSAARPGAVFGEPVTVGNYTVITASEVGSGGGFGSGMGFGPAPDKQKRGAAAEAPGMTAEEPPASGGGGVGGGGGAGGRPVAVIIIGPDGVKIEHVFDLTKIALAGIAAWGGMLMAMRSMRKAGKG